MGADLACAFFEIPKDRKPDFAAASKHIDTLDEKQCRELVAGALMADDDEQIDEYLRGRKARIAVREALIFVLDAWDEAYRHTVVLQLSETNLLFVGDTTWGDDVEGLTEFSIFDLSGCAKLAGFLVK